MSGQASVFGSATPLGAGTNLEDLLQGVAEFAAAEITGRIKAFDEPLTPADLVAIEAAATAADLLDSGAGGSGLWADTGSGGDALFSVLALRLLARASGGAAHALHGAAMARAAADALWSEPPAAGTTLTLGGRCASGGAALGRLLAGTAPAGADTATLEDLYGPGPRLRRSADSQAPWLGLVYTRGELQLAEFAGGGWIDPAPHGPDGLAAITQDAAGPVRSSAPGGELLGAIFARHQLGIVAIAQGAADVAVERAAGYAASRVQGGGTICGHDAVALMLADSSGAVRAVEAQMQATVAAGPEPSAAAAIVLRRTALPLLRRAADAAVQVHGGSGYMRDTGVEHLLRELNALSVTGGSADDLGLLLAALLDPAAGVHTTTGSDRQIAGHVAASSPLSPQPGFRRNPITRVLSAYRVLDPWERDTHELPRALRGYRRRIRDFAQAQLVPLALDLDLAMRDSDARPPELDRLLRSAARAGFHGDLLPQPVGSVPPHVYSTSLVLQHVVKTEELACADGGLMLLLSAHNLGLSPVLFSGNRHAYRDVVLPALRASAGGDPQLFAYAITEPGAGSDAEDGHGAAQARPGLVATRAAGGWKLDGSKIFISGGDRARWVVAFAALEDEGFESWTAFLVDAHASGFTRLRNEHKLGMRASGATALAFDGCFVPDEMVLGGLRGGWALNRATLNFSRLPVAAMSVGFARRATEIATAFACREQLAGRPLIDRQHVQLAIADMQAETAAIRSLVWHFARRRVPEQAKASLAKFHASDRAQVVIERAFDVLGEQGLLHDNELEKVFRDNRLVRIFEGTNQINRLAVIEDQQELLLAATHGRVPSA